MSLRLDDAGKRNILHAQMAIRMLDLDLRGKDKILCYKSLLLWVPTAHWKKIISNAAPGWYSQLSI